MAVGVSLLDLVRDLRAEIGHSLIAAHGVNSEETLRYLLKRTQEQLWVEYDWPARKIRRTIDLAAGDTLYNYPADMPYDKVNRVHYSQDGTNWMPVERGINACDLTAYPNGTTSEPYKWENNADQNMLEIWPAPSTNGTLLLVGHKALKPLVQDNDRCEIDGTLIVLRASAELAARQKLSDAEIKLQAANNFALMLLRQQASHKDSTFIMGGGISPHTHRRRPTPGLDYIP